MLRVYFGIVMYVGLKYSGIVTVVAAFFRNLKPL